MKRQVKIEIRIGRISRWLSGLSAQSASIATVVAAATLLSASAAVADSYAPDPSFGTDGVVKIPGLQRDVQNGSTRWLEAKVQQNGKILMLGERLASPAQYSSCTEPVVTRLLPDGSPDSSFGVNAVVGPISLTPICARLSSFAVAADGKIYIAADCTNHSPSGVCGAQKPGSGGYERLGTGVYVVGLNADGSPNQSFGTNGVYTYNYDNFTCACTVPPYGFTPNRYVVVAKSQAEGSETVSLEAVYSPTSASDIDVLPNGEPVVAGASRILTYDHEPTDYYGEYQQNWGLGLFPDNPQANLDLYNAGDPFGEDRPGSIEFTDVVAAPSGKVYFAEIWSDDTYTPEPYGGFETYDPATGEHGYTKLPSPPTGSDALPIDIIVDSAGRPVVGFGRYEKDGWRLMLLRGLEDGAADTSFGDNGMAEFSSTFEIDGFSNLPPVASLTGGQLLMQGRLGQLYRIAADGQIDSSFGCGGSVQMPSGWQHAFPTGLVVGPGETVLRLGWPSDDENEWSLYRERPVAGDGCELPGGEGEGPGGGGGETSPSGDGPSSSGPGGTSGDSPASGAPSSKTGAKQAHAVKCKKGFKKKKVHGKSRCVKVKSHRHGKRGK